MLGGRGVGGLGEKGERISSTKKYLQNSKGNIQYSTRNIVNNIVVTMYGARWVFELSGWSDGESHHFINNYTIA